MTGGSSSRALATGAILLGLVISAFEGTVVTSAMPTITAELGGLGIYGWVFSAFLVASTISVLTCGKLADAFGRRPVFTLGMTLFLIGSALSGASRSIDQLIAFRVIQGLGAGAIQPIAMTISADLYTLRERARVQALFTGAWGSANVLGPLIGGFIVMHTSWRWVFLVNLPIGAVTIALLFASYRDPPRLPEGRPIVLTTLLLDRVVIAGVVGSVFAGGLLYACSAYVPLWMSRQLHTDALAAGGALVPLLAGWAVGSSFGVRVLVRWGMRASVGGGFAIASAGAAALALCAVEGLSAHRVYAALALLGIGLGPAASTSMIAPQSYVPWQSRGMITSIIYASRMLGGSLTVAVLGSVAALGAPAGRFLGVATIALAALAILAFLAPTTLREADQAGRSANTSTSTPGL